MLTQPYKCDTFILFFLCVMWHLSATGKKSSYLPLQSSEFHLLDGTQFSVDRKGVTNLKSNLYLKLSDKYSGAKNICLEV